MNALAVSIVRSRGVACVLSGCFLECGTKLPDAVRTVSTVGNAFFGIKDPKEFVNSIFNDRKDGDSSLEYVKNRLASVLDTPVQAGESAEELSPSEREVRISLAWNMRIYLLNPPVCTSQYDPIFRQHWSCFGCIILL